MGESWYSPAIMVFRRLCGTQYALRPLALEAGLLAKVFDDAESMYAAAYELTAYIAAQPPYGMYGIKTLTNRVNDMSFETFAAFEAELVANGVHTQDFKGHHRAVCNR